MPLTPIRYDLLSDLYKRSVAEPVRTGDHLTIDRVYDGTLAECIQEFMEKPTSQRPLYELHTEAQAAFPKTILSASDMLEIASRDDFPKD